MQYDIFRSGHDPDLRSNFQHDHIRSSGAVGLFDVYRQKEHSACKMIVVTFLGQKLLPKNMFRKNVYLEFLLSGG